MLPDSGGTVLYDLLHQVLDAIVATFDEQGVDLPDRRYVAFGPVAADCAQLTVSLDQHYKGTPGGDPNSVVRCNGPRTAVLTVQLFRPTASLNNRGLPSADSLDASARTHLRDAELLLDAADRIDSEMWQTGVIATVDSAEVAGGFNGCHMSLVVPV